MSAGKLMVCFLTACVVRLVHPAAAQGALPRCGDRETVLLLPWTDTSRWCPERVIDDPGAGELAFTALAVGADGVLYAARPLAGEVLAFADTDDDGLPDWPQVIADNLTLPNSLAYHEGALYIAGGAHIYRLEGGRLETLAADLPSGGGFWTGGLAVGPDGRIYVGTGAPCDYCAPRDEGRGAILSFAPDGGDRQIVGRGLRQPAALAFHLGSLWVVDTARDALVDAPDLDELNRVAPGAHFGWPYCIGADSRRDLDGGFDCEQATPPALTFPTHSTPLALAAYTSDALPSLKGTLLVALAGKHDAVDLPGYQVVAVEFDADGNPAGTSRVIPMTRPDAARLDSRPANLNYQGRGFWPHRPLGIAVSPEGWVYVSVGGGQILALRPP